MFSKIVAPLAAQESERPIVAKARPSDTCLREDCAHIPGNHTVAQHEEVMRANPHEIEVNGERAVFNGATGAVGETRPFIETSAEDLIHGIAQKRIEIKEAKKVYSAAGSRVKTLNDDLEEMLAEVDRRDERAQTPELELV